MAYELKKPYDDIQRADFIVQYSHQQGLVIEETDEALYALEPNEIMVDNKPVVDPQYEEKQAALRRSRFENEFIETSYVKNGTTGWYRQAPKGYANAPQSLEIVNKYAQKFQGVNEELASMLIFYPCPDFTDPEQCTEEWLITHQFNPDTMTLQQWEEFTYDFDKRWAALNYKQSLETA